VREARSTRGIALRVKQQLGIDCTEGRCDVRSLGEFELHDERPAECAELGDLANPCKQSAPNAAVVRERDNTAWITGGAHDSKATPRPLAAAFGTS
jgi:hypothetical protein